MRAALVFDEDRFGGFLCFDFADILAVQFVCKCGSVRQKDARHADEEGQQFPSPPGQHSMNESICFQPRRLK